MILTIKSGGNTLICVLDTVNDVGRPLVELMKLMCRVVFVCPKQLPIVATLDWPQERQRCPIVRHRPGVASVLYLVAVENGIKIRNWLIQNFNRA